MRRYSLQRFEPIAKVIATGFGTIAIVANVIMEVRFQVKVFVVMVLKGWD